MGVKDHIGSILNGIYNRLFNHNPEWQYNLRGGLETAVLSLGSRRIEVKLHSDRVSGRQGSVAVGEIWNGKDYALQGTFAIKHLYNPSADETKTGQYRYDDRERFIRNSARYIGVSEERFRGYFETLKDTYPQTLDALLIYLHNSTPVTKAPNNARRGAG